MDQAIATAAMVKPPPGTGRYHILVKNGLEGTFCWDDKRNFWTRAGAWVSPRDMAFRGWVYVRPQCPPVAAAPTPPTPPDEIGPDMMVNAQGFAVKAHLVPARVKLEDQTVNELLAGAKTIREKIAAFKASAMSDVSAFLDVLFDTYQVKRTGGRGGVELTSFNGLRRVTVSVQDAITLGSEIQAAKALIDDCIVRWSKGADDNLMAIINDAFQVGESGKLRVQAILGLRRLDINDDGWRMAMNAMGDAIRKETSRSYVRFYERPNVDAPFEQIVLDMSRV